MFINLHDGVDQQVHHGKQRAVGFDPNNCHTQVAGRSCWCKCCQGHLIQAIQQYTRVTA